MTVQMPRVRYEDRRTYWSPFWREVSWYLTNWLLRSVIYLTIFALAYLAIWAQDPRAAERIISGKGIDLWCTRAPFLNSEVMTCSKNSMIEQNSMIVGVE